MEIQELARYPVTAGIIAINILVFALVNLKAIGVDIGGRCYIKKIQNKRGQNVVEIKS